MPDYDLTPDAEEDLFSPHEANARVLIVAILHEKMDLMARLRDRLDRSP